jgi:hypothetical protein
VGLKPKAQLPDHDSIKLTNRRIGCWTGAGRAGKQSAHERKEKLVAFAPDNLLGPTRKRRRCTADHGAFASSH